MHCTVHVVAKINKKAIHIVKIVLKSFSHGAVEPLHVLQLLELCVQVIFLE